MTRGARDYRLSAKLHFSTTIGPLDVEVTQAGNLGTGLGTIGVR